LFRQESKAQTLIRVRGNTGNILIARTYTLNYFIVVVNKFSCLGVVNYQITEIDGFFKEGCGKGVRQAQGRPVIKEGIGQVYVDPGRQITLSLY
jgi:hypothetical protein